jgi:hypothetical protein
MFVQLICSEVEESLETFKRGGTWAFATNKIEQKDIPSRTIVVIFFIVYFLAPPVFTGTKKRNNCAIAHEACNCPEPNTTLLILFRSFLTTKDILI